MSAYQRWLKRLRRGEAGEVEGNSSTWVLDDIWRAACNELTKREHEAMVRRDERRANMELEAVKRLQRQMRGIP